MYIDHCVGATQIVANGESTKPVIIAELVSINDLGPSKISPEFS
jgi:hypothetical protein